MNKNSTLILLASITLIFSLISPSLDLQAFAQTSDENREALQKQQDERLRQLEERKQQAKENLEKQKQKMEEQREKARKELEAKQQKAKNELNEQRKEVKNSIEDRKQQAREELERKRELARQQLEEKRKEIKDRESSDDLKDRAEKIREELRIKMDEKRSQAQDKVSDKQAELRERIEYEISKLKETSSDKREELKLRILENRNDLRDNLLEKKSELKDKLRNKALEKVRTEYKENFSDKIKKITDERLKHKINLEMREQMNQEIASVKQELILEYDEKAEITSELRDKAKEAIKNNVSLTRDDLDAIRNELKNRIEYKSELIEAKIQEVGKDKFNELKIQYKEKLRDKSLQKFNEIKLKIKSQGLVTQVEDGTYFGTNEIKEYDSINYQFSFDGSAVKYQDPSVLRTISGDVSLELISLSDVNAKLKVVGGRFSVVDPSDESVSNVWDASFGRARVLLDRNAMQITINAVDQNGKHATFRMQAETDGLFPVSYGDSPLGIDATNGRTSISGAWVLNLSGALVVSEPIPVSELTDVETSVQQDIVTQEISKDVIGDMIIDVNNSISDILLSEDFSDLTPEEIEQIKKELEAELLAELQFDLSNDIEDEVEQAIQGNSQ